ncbi:MAG: hypothetical protein QM594_22170 [Niabella sp.]
MKNQARFFFAGKFALGFNKWQGAILKKTGGFYSIQHKTLIINSKILSIFSFVWLFLRT